MALALVLAVTNSDIKSMNEIKNRLRLTENLFIRIPIVDIESPTESESSSGVSSLSPSIESSTPKPSPPLSRSDSPIKTTTPDTTSSTSEESKKCLKVPILLSNNQSMTCYLLNISYLIKSKYFLSVYVDKKFNFL